MVRHHLLVNDPTEVGYVREALCVQLPLAKDSAVPEEAVLCHLNEVAARAEGRIPAGSPSIEQLFRNRPGWMEAREFYFRMLSSWRVPCAPGILFGFASADWPTVVPVAFFQKVNADKTLFSVETQSELAVKREAEAVQAKGGAERH